MDLLNVVASTVGLHLTGLAERLYGCAHRRTTFPITLRVSEGLTGRQSAQSETYIACLECGRHFPYDWTAMQIARRVA